VTHQDSWVLVYFMMLHQLHSYMASNKKWICRDVGRSDCREI